MKTALKKKLSLVLVLLVSLFAGFSITTSAANTKNLAFTSDVHFNKDRAAESPITGWLDNLKTVVPSVDYFGICGDLGSAYAASPTLAYWDHVQALMDIVDGYATSGFIKNKTIYAFGNHEWYTVGGGDYAKNSDNATAQKYTKNGEVVKTDDYIIYAFGPIGTTESYGAAQMYALAEIATLKAYMETAPKNIPIILMAHFPIHTYTSKVTTKAAELIDMLNMFPNIIFLWGHNHSNADTNYDKIFTAGDTIKVGAADATTDKSINFTYASAGCMSDAEYTASARSTGSTPGGAKVLGKGLLLTINGSHATLKYYDLTGKELTTVTKTVDVAAGAPVASP